MYLLNVTSKTLEEFSDDQTPPYAILSHRWGKPEDEISFLEVNSQNIDESKPAWAKLEGCCEQAKRVKINYVWIDTCCINKQDGHHLDSINSMFEWYQKAKVCYAYLFDVAPDENFTKAEWFERGWTLQELLAPKKKVEFYNNKWICIGTRESLAVALEEKTGISRKVLRGEKDMLTESVAQRMSWAARRKTKIATDMAYCLLGIFGISFKTLYHEDDEGADAAFRKLQIEIFNRTGDDSILAWTHVPANLGHRNPKPQGGLAGSPLDYVDSRKIVSGPSTKPTKFKIEFNNDSLQLTRDLYTDPSGMTFIILRCYSRSNRRARIGIPVERRPGYLGKTYDRLQCENFEFLVTSPKDCVQTSIRLLLSGHKHYATKYYQSNPFRLLEPRYYYEAPPALEYDSETPPASPEPRRYYQMWTEPYQGFIPDKTAETPAVGYLRKTYEEECNWEKQNGLKAPQQHDDGSVLPIPGSLMDFDDLYIGSMMSPAPGTVLHDSHLHHRPANREDTYQNTFTFPPHNFTAQDDYMNNHQLVGPSADFQYETALATPDQYSLNNLTDTSYAGGEGDPSLRGFLKGPAIGTDEYDDCSGIPEDIEASRTPSESTRKSALHGKKAKPSRHIHQSRYNSHKRNGSKERPSRSTERDDDNYFGMAEDTKYPDSRNTKLYLSEVNDYHIMTQPFTYIDNYEENPAPGYQIDSSGVGSLGPGDDYPELSGGNEAQRRNHKSGLMSKGSHHRVKEAKKSQSSSVRSGRYHEDNYSERTDYIGISNIRKGRHRR
ncbi:heterokaryon incompatibility protein-domain-containing protein [Truncatella angustata]|uniref:Heterokaryon incompatibility protein-domain-containing protein n=1 Tax=Truncatella angustata TaxID=152316 RepID=A0A9P8ULJ2_9PEZI|nr:heterokaryon incompatibility protein-domain-containing protein [Truncatella angustata]KAH6654195.1 heterokaryon incompatibility protein-domain-containing protein [Truncatella angustata]